jgi:F420-non-reducing hydrogenase large subunit
MSYPIIWDDKVKSESKRIEIDPITRLEGHGKIEIFLDDNGNVAQAYWQIPELRGFERFTIGRQVTEMNQIVSRLCGVCPGAHHIAATKAVDKCYHMKPTETALKLRDLFYQAHYIHSHIAHFFALAAPDFLPGPAAPVAERNILGLVGIVGLETGGAVIKARSYAQRIQEIMGGKATHPTFGIPGGVTMGLNEEQRKEIEKMGEFMLDFSKTAMTIFNDVVLANKDYVDIIANPDIFYHETYYMGIVDDDNKVNFYDGKIRVVDPEGKEFCKFHEDDYLEHVAEHVEPWSYEKFPFLKKIGWKGLVDGKDSSIYRAAPLARLNAADGFTTPLAQEEYERYFGFFRDLGVKGPVHHTLCMHWARLIELIYSSEKVMELIQDPDITSQDYKQKPESPGGSGVGVIEAPRGTLFHHYVCDEEGIVTDTNLIVGTTNNNGPINMSVKKAAQALIKNWEISPGLLNMVEMAYRAYDPCNSCATHSLPGQMPIKATIRDLNGNVYREITRN